MSISHTTVRPCKEFPMMVGMTPIFLLLDSTPLPSGLYEVPKVLVASKGYHWQHSCKQNG
jgi:hypothetical protein